MVKNSEKLNCSYGKVSHLNFSDGHWNADKFFCNQWKPTGFLANKHWIFITNFGNIILFIISKYKYIVYSRSQIYCNKLFYSKI